MVLKSTFAAVLCTGFLALGGAAVADEYRPDEFLRLDLSKVVLSPKRLGPEAEFAPVPIEARTDRVRTTTVTEPGIVPRKTHVAAARATPPRTPARTRLAHRHGNPLDAQARDARIQTWPCKSGGICGWQR